MTAAAQATRPPRRCSIDGCGRKHFGHGWCQLHYGRWARYGDPLAEPPARIIATCSIEGCDKPASSRGWCKKHYTRWERHGDPLALSWGPPLERILRQIVIEPEGCWIFTGHTNKPGIHGYGVLAHEGGRVLVHRFMYEQYVGPIPEGLEIDHLCRRKRCCCPDHLEPVSHAENVRRAVGIRTECERGHPWTTENVSNDGRCRLCRNAAKRRYVERKRTVCGEDVDG
jgi:hypothetical protein